MTEEEVREAVLTVIENWAFDILLPEQKAGIEVIMRLTCTEKMCVNFTDEVMRELKKPRGKRLRIV